MFFNWKSRKELLQEIEELKVEVNKYRNWWLDKSDKFHSINRNIRTIGASCIHDCNKFDEKQNEAIIKECLCKQLTKELMSYVSIEECRYAPIAPYLDGETKYVATLKIIEE